MHLVWSRRADLGGVGTTRVMHGPRNTLTQSLLTVLLFMSTSTELKNSCDARCVITHISSWDVSGAM